MTTPVTNPAQGYEAYMVPALFQPWASCLLESTPPRPGERVLDVGCGTGVVARQAAASGAVGGSVTGLDASADMLAVARDASKREGRVIDWREGRAEEMPFTEGSFDVVLSQFALMFFGDRPAALAEMHRVLTSGGRIAVSVWQGLDRHPFYETLHGVIQRRAGISALELIFALGDVAALRILLTDAGFRSVEIQSLSMTARFPNPAAFLAGEIDVDTAAIPSMQGLDTAARQRIVAAIAQDMEAPLRDVTEGDEVVLPFHAHIARAVR